MKKNIMELDNNNFGYTFVKVLSKPYQHQAQNGLDNLLEILEELSNVAKKFTTLHIEIQNLHYQIFLYMILNYDSDYIIIRKL